MFGNQHKELDLREAKLGTKSVETESHAEAHLKIEE